MKIYGTLKATNELCGFLNEFTRSDQAAPWFRNIQLHDLIKDGWHVIASTIEPGYNNVRYHFILERDC